MFDDGLAFEDGAHLSARMGHDLEGSAFAAPDARDQLAGRMDEATPRVRYRIPGKRIGGDALDVLHGRSGQSFSWRPLLFFYLELFSIFVYRGRFVKLRAKKTALDGRFRMGEVPRFY